MKKVKPINKRTNVLIAISNIAIGGGAEKVATVVANQFLAQNIDTTLLTFYTSEQEHVFKGKRFSMHENTPASVFKKIPRAIGRIRKVKKVCKEEKIDLVISFLEESNYYVLLSKVLLGNKVRMIVSVRNDPSAYKILYKILIRTLYPFAEKVVAVTKGVEKTLQEKFNLSHTTTIYNPLDYADIEEKLTEELPQDMQWLTKGSPVFVTIGRLARQKGQWHLIRAFSDVVAKHPQARLCIIGEGPYRKKLESIITESNLNDNVFLLGKQKNVYPFLRVADVFVLPSLWEGLPNALLEAVASGTYVVATDASTGAREILAPDVSLDAHLEYPLYTDNGTLIAPASEDGDIDKVLTKEGEEYEARLAQALCIAIEKKTLTNTKTDDRFLTKNILDQWKALL